MGSIAAFEERRCVRLPSDFREYLMAANGMAPPRDTDDEGFCFWPIERICPVVESNASAATFEDAVQYFIFADYLQWSWAYAIRLSPDGSSQNPVVIVGSKSGVPQRLADTFTAFVDLYFKGWENIWIA